METKFTKGKWVPSSKDVSCKSNVICEYPSFGESETNIWYHNAKLIASAPCLLDALEYGKQISEKLHFPTEEELKQFVNMATEAIKKATE